jgi:hypothetical protein
VVSCRDSNRYAITADGMTNCNIYVWDVTRAMGVELPRYYNGDKTRAAWLFKWLTGEVHKSSGGLLVPVRTLDGGS